MKAFFNFGSFKILFCVKMAINNDTNDVTSMVDRTRTAFSVARKVNFALMNSP